MHIEFVPLQFYSLVYWCVIILAAVAVAVQFLGEQQENTSILRPTRNLTGSLLAFFSVFYIGFRPISNAFVDMVIYANEFRKLQDGGESNLGGDFGFSTFASMSSNLMDENFFFFFCAVLYIFPIFFATRHWSFNYWYFLFTAFLGSFSFWAYGVNGIRHGIASSILVLAFSYVSFWPTLFFSLLAISFHKSVLLPVIGFYVASTRINIVWFFRFWLLAIPSSWILGSFWESLFGGFGFVDDRIGLYVSSSQSGNTITQTGFRWDFLLYSLSGVVFAYLYVFKQKFDDPVYKRVLGAYLFSNAIWILIIRADFSNRFAYLSWFLLAFVIFYPLIKIRIFQNHNVVTACLLLMYCLFSVFMGIFRA